VESEAGGGVREEVSEKKEATGPKVGMMRNPECCFLPINNFEELFLVFSLCFFFCDRGEDECVLGHTAGD
jgi:hypothetical protein